MKTLITFIILFFSLTSFAQLKNNHTYYNSTYKIQKTGGISKHETTIRTSSKGKLKVNHYEEYIPSVEEYTYYASGRPKTYRYMAPCGVMCTVTYSDNPPQYTSSGSSDYIDDVKSLLNNQDKG